MDDKRRRESAVKNAEAMERAARETVRLLKDAMSEAERVLSFAIDDAIDARNIAGGVAGDDEHE